MSTPHKHLNCSNIVILLIEIMCVPTSPDYVPTLPNNFQVIPPSPEFGFDFVNAFASDDEEEPFEDLTNEQEEEPMPTNFSSNTSNYFEQN